MISYMRCLQAAGLAMATAMVSAYAGSFSSDFNSGALPPGSHTNANAAGGAYLELSGGVSDSGCLKLNKNINSQNGSLILDDLDAGQPIYGFDASFKLRIGGGTETPADGLSLVVDSSLSDSSLFGESGTSGGLSFDWDIYNNPDTPPSPQINVKVLGNMVAWKGYTIAGITTSGDVTTWWTDVHIRLNADGSLNLDYKGENIFTNLFLPGYQGFVDAGTPVRFGLGARTGGLNANQWIDNLQITTFTRPLVGISQQPVSKTALQGDDIQFDVRVGNTNGVVYQWYANGVAVAGGTDQSLKVANVQPSLAGSTYMVTATGPNNALTSSVVSLNVTNLLIPVAPQLSFNFNSGTPAGATVLGTALVDSTGGIGGSGCLKLTAGQNDQSGALLVSDPNAGAPVYGFTARFQAGVGGGTTPPADGWAFAFGNDIPDDPTSGSPMFEEGGGLGTGLRVCFDVYNNDTVFGYSSGEPTPAPSIDVRFGNTIVATKQLPLSFLETGVNPELTPVYADTVIQLNSDGTLNVVFRGELVFNHLPIPGFSSMTGGRFALVARTGGLNENFWFDNLEITSVLTSGTVHIANQSGNQSILVNHAMTNTVSVNDPTGVTYQWYRGASAIGGATGSAYVLSPVSTADAGAVFMVTATKSSVTVTSAPVTLTVVNLTSPSTPQFSFNFDDGLTPAGAGVYGDSYVASSGGAGDSGCFHLTDNINSQNGSFVVSNLVFGGNLVSSISVSFDLREGGGSGSPADGFSFNWAAGLPNAIVANSETGTGNGVSLCFRRYVGGGNTDNPPSPYIGIKYNGSFVATTQIPGAELDTDLAGTPAYRTMLFRVDPDGKVFLAYGDRVLYNGLQLTNFTYIANSKFGIYGRTGGENNNQWFDNLKIQATQATAPMAVVTQPANALVMVGQPAIFSVVLNNPANATYQWQKNGVNITGATASSYTTPATTLADNGAQFRVTGSGASGTITSSNAVLTAVTPITVSNPTKTYNFDDCNLPPDTIINGANASAGYVACNGGVGDSGVLHMTDNVNSLQSTFIMPDFVSNASVKAITVSMAVRIAEGTGTPADGISFAWGSSNSIPDTLSFGEGGAGDGVSVGLITYAGRADGPSFNVWYNGTRLVNKIVPYSALSTGDLGVDPQNQYATLAFRVNENGTLDLQYKGNAILNGLPIPGYKPIIGGRFAIGARTGGENESQWIDNLQIAETVGTITPAVSLGWSAAGGKLTLTWPAGWKLQSSSSLTSANWQDVVGASSPYLPPLTASGGFYRLKASP